MFYSLDHLIYEMKTTQRQFTLVAFLFALFAIMGIYGVVNCAPVKDASNPNPKVYFIGLFKNQSTTFYHVLEFQKSVDVPSIEDDIFSNGWDSSSFIEGADLSAVIETPFLLEPEDPKGDTDKETASPNTIADEFVNCFADESVSRAYNGSDAKLILTYQDVDEFSNFFLDYSTCINISISKRFPLASVNGFSRTEGLQPLSQEEYLSELFSCMRAVAYMRDLGLPLPTSSDSLLHFPIGDDDIISKRVANYQCLTSNLEAFYYSDVNPLFLSMLSGTLDAVSKCIAKFKKDDLEYYSLVEHNPALVLIDATKFEKQVWYCECYHWIGILSEKHSQLEEILNSKRTWDSEDSPTEASISTSPAEDVDMVIEVEVVEGQGEHNQFPTCPLTKGGAKYFLFLFVAVTFLVVLFLTRIVYERATMRMQNKLVQMTAPGTDEIMVQVIGVRNASTGGPKFSNDKNSSIKYEKL